MKNIKLTGFKKLWLVPMAAMAFAVWMSLPGSTQKVQAGCTIAGYATYIAGVPTCDCTQASPSTCACVVTCPKGGGEGGEEPENN